MRILAPGGIMFHSVNCGDHYAYVDRSINELNYLRYSDPQWRLWDNAFLYQNRMRAHEFVERAEAAGFDIVLNTARATEQPAPARGNAGACAVRQHSAGTPVHHDVDFIARKPESASH